MIKTLSKAQKMEREKFRIPRSVQDAIPIRRIFADGIFQVGNQYSKTWSFTDINYAIASKEDKTSMFLDYSELLNALDSGASAKITIYNRRINKAEFERSVLLPDRDDGLGRIPPRIQPDADRTGHRHQQQHCAGALSDRKRGKTQRGRSPQLLCPRRHGSGDAPCAAFLGGAGVDADRAPAHFPRLFQSRGTGCGRVQYPRTRQTRAAFQGLVLPPTAWSLPPTISSWMRGMVGCCICRTMPATSRTALCRNSATLTAI